MASTSRPGSLPLLLALALALLTWTTPRAARAWVEAHVLGDDARLELDRDGRARVEHRLTLKVAGGPLRSYDVRGVDPDAVLAKDAYVVTARDAGLGSLASATPVSLAVLEPGETSGGGAGIRIRFDGGTGKGISRGVFVITLRYTTDLIARGVLKKSGATATMAWRGPIWDDGFDSARATFVVPTAPTEPRLDEAVAEGPEADHNAPTFLSTVRRGPDGDELQLLRPYASKGEQVVWPIRLDARALGPVRAEPEPLAPLSVPRATDPADGKRTMLLAAGAGAVVLFALLIVLKTLEAARHARAGSAIARPLIPLPLFARAPLGGLTLVGGVALELTVPNGTWGALLVGAAAALAAHRTPQWQIASRGPGRWLPISEKEAFARVRPTGAYLDTTTRAGKVLLLLLLSGAGAGVWFVARTSAYHATLLGLDVVVLLALFGTGRIAELPPDPVAGRAALLSDVARRIKKRLGPKEADGLRIVPRIRVPNGAADADELRLLIMPKTPHKGLTGIEVGVVLIPGVGGTISMPEVLARFIAGSPCEAALARTARRGRSMRGRRPDERVLAFSPRLPTARMTAAIAAALVVRATDQGRENAAPVKRAA